MENQPHPSSLKHQDLFNALRYELPWFIGVSAGLLLLGTLLIYLLPNIYTARAEVMIEPGGTYTGDNKAQQAVDMTPRAHAILKSLMTSENIEKLLIKQGLMGEQVTPEDTHAAIEDFRDNTRVDFDNVEIINQYTGREGKYSLGFSIQHESTSPDQAYQVVLDLTDQLLSSTEKRTTKEDKQKLAFLETQIESAKSRLEATEAEVATFKEKNAANLPEVQSFAIRRLEDLESKLTEANQNLKRLRRSSDDLHAELATKNQQVTLYSSDGARVPGLEEKLLVLKNEYIQKSTSYTKQHPDMQSLSEEISDLKAAIKRERTSQSRSNTALNDPVYSLMLSRTAKIGEEIEHEVKLKEEINASLHKVNSQLERMPFVAQELKRLERDQTFAATKYKELESELVNLEINTGRRDAKLLGQFQLLEQPTYPLSPTKPKKKILMIVLVLLAGSAGYLAALIMYLIHDKINNVEDIELITKFPTYIVPDFNQFAKNRLFKSDMKSGYEPLSNSSKQKRETKDTGNFALETPLVNDSQSEFYKQLEDQK